MAVATRTLKDTAVNAAGAGGKVTILVNWDDETSSNNNILDASGLKILSALDLNDAAKKIVNAIK